MRLEGMHHITAITGDAPRNVDFYTRVLGLRLVAKTVNQDDPSVYHLFYADERGRPGAELTFFEYPRATPGRAGAGMVHRIVSRVGSDDALAFWAERFAAEGVAHERVGDRLRFADPEGLGHELVVRTGGDTPLSRRAPRDPGRAGAAGLRRRARLQRAPRAQRPRARASCSAPRRWARTRWELRGEVRGGTIAYDAPPAEPGRQSAGTVHHVAWGTTVAEHPRWDEHLRDAGVPTSGIIDRHYFHSIYFREPSGVLFEIADDGPGFTVDGYSVEELGSAIILPPQLEPQRERIEAILTPLPDPRAERSPAR